MSFFSQNLDLHYLKGEPHECTVLKQDLEKENIQIIHVRGDEFPDELLSITSFLQQRVPASGRWILSLSNLDYLMKPTYPNKLEEKHLISQEYHPFSKPSTFLLRLNFERDAIVKTFPVPVIFWVSEAAIRQMAEHAPDFYDFRRFIIDLPQPMN
ncbi:MAG: hypothetical protein MUF15_11825 [Acidobacteria bacterium]|nr:hypothetical protein [Acidobacteriota bacterium]